MDNAHEPDLFGNVPPAGQSYPQFPGAKVGGTSMQAAMSVALHAATVRAHALAEFRAAHPGGLTADECARLLGESILTVRPRVSELRAGGYLEPTADTRPNADSGHSARVWRATAKVMEASQ